MRNDLAPFAGKRIIVQGVFKYHKNYRGKEVARVDLVHDHDGDMLTDHVYVQYADSLVAYDFRPDEQIQFKATVTRYKKHGEIDYGLAFPTAIKSLEREIAMPSLTREERPTEKRHPQFLEPIPEEPRPAPAAPQPEPSPSPKAGLEPVDQHVPGKISRADLVNGMQRLLDQAGWDEFQKAFDYLRP
jgi:hypothetical protein